MKVISLTHISQVTIETNEKLKLHHRTDLRRNKSKSIARIAHMQILNKLKENYIFDLLVSWIFFECKVSRQVSVAALHFKWTQFSERLLSYQEHGWNFRLFSFPWNHTERMTVKNTHTHTRQMNRQIEMFVAECIIKCSKKL